MTRRELLECVIRFRFLTELGEIMTEGGLSGGKKMSGELLQPMPTVCGFPHFTLIYKYFLTPLSFFVYISLKLMKPFNFFS